MNSKTAIQKVATALVLALFGMSDLLLAQEMFNVNVWSIGRPASRGGIWGDGFDDEEELAMVMLDGDTPAGAPGWETVEWQNVELDPNPFAKSTPATEITGTSGSNATFQMFNRRNAASYNWNSLRDDSDLEDLGNATLLDGHVNSTEFDDANGGGNPFGFQISDFEIRNIPFATYDAVIYLGINGGQTFSGYGTIRINEDVDRPDDPEDWGFSVIDQGGLDMSGGIRFSLPPTLHGFEPDGILEEIEEDEGVGNYIVFTGLTDSTLKVQTWGEGFTHLGLAGFQIREVGGGMPGDYNGDGVLDAIDLDLQAAEMQKAPAEQDLAKFDLNNDGVINVGTNANPGDRLLWIKDLRMTWVGDSNLDGIFDSRDFVLVFGEGKYNTGEAATWTQGDWTGNLVFDSGDLVLAFQDGGYIAGATSAVPEPSTLGLLLASLAGVGIGRRSKQRYRQAVR